MSGKFEREQLGKPFPFEYKAPNGFPAGCEISLYEHEDTRIVVVADVGLGPSVTNFVETIATRLREQGIIWDVLCEYEPADPEINRDEMFSWVSFTWKGHSANSPQWKHATRQDVETLIGRPFTT